jgi:hypothetical protein
MASALHYEPSKPYLEAICRRIVRSLVERHRRRPAMPAMNVLG